ncbi:F-box only protein 34 isoform X2 [Pristis pectinata]|uniref:F-box only protein 34 isoform X2 n=1 Tax=Pristis pectinata TaxID=685728 RepID=UPI00223D9C9A|nr:F-box only protein 34 isoform X2 [Pristis pectinata]XP_051866630.1 F-box only protein 34 isoform X2 [Pristis pectinata]XP_051866639.1 F-box only protein 34 isoform X2 [Pristis pectinata]XP_051866644.1 F-box only protein 34 isoform X2 [Pristis pectinata]
MLFLKLPLDLNVTSRISQTVCSGSRIATMHLKPYPKLQKKDASLESSQEALRELHSSHHTTVGVERCQSTCNKPLCCKSFALASHISLWCPRPFSFISQNKMCNMRNPADNVSFKGRKKHMSENILPPSIHQEEGEAQLDIWAVIKPGNTKEKIAFFAAHQCNNRTSSMKLKSSWDAEVTTAKRRRKSIDLEKVKIQPMRKDSVKDIDRRYLRADPQTTSNCDENSNVNLDKQNADGHCHSSSLSVAEMVALLEQRANSLLPDCSKMFTNANAHLPSIAHSKVGSPSVEAISHTGSESGLSHKKSTENKKLQGEYVRVIEVIAKLESECLKNQHNRNGEARNNSFRRGVGRVLLTNPHLSEESTKSTGIIRKSTGAPRTVDNIGQSKEQCSHISSNYTKPCTEPQDNVPSLAINFSGVVFDLSSKEASLTHKEATSLPNSTREHCSSDVEISVESCNSPSLCWEMDNKFVSNFTLAENGMGEYANNFIVNELESCVVDRNMVKRVKEATECTSVTRFNPCEEPLPGELFFTLEQSHMENLDSIENTTEEILDIAHCRDDFLIAESRTFNRSCSEANQSNSLTPFGTMYPSLTEPFPLRRQVSHEFLETRFKIQQLLEPRQYMAFLPHHIMVKIFMFLPTKTLAALKCSCHYFKFIIENYDIRATDSRWVCDPRYKDDPCKQCKKHYSKGDVSQCRWHSKPYYKVVPYGRSYWMCCWQTEKDSPGCKIGLHDNNWVQSHNHMQQICEKV